MSICFVDDVLYITYNISFNPLTKRVTLRCFVALPLALMLACNRCGIIFDKLVHCYTYFPPDWPSFFSMTVYWSWVRSDGCIKGSSAHLKDGVKVWTLLWPIHVWKWCLMLFGPLFHHLSPMNAAIVIWEDACTIRAGRTWSFSTFRQSAGLTVWA